MAEYCAKKNEIEILYFYLHQAAIVKRRRNLQQKLVELSPPFLQILILGKFRDELVVPIIKAAQGHWSIFVFLI